MGINKGKIAFVLASACVMTTLSNGEEIKAETRGEVKKVSVLKTSSLKVENTIVADAGQAKVEEAKAVAVSSMSYSVVALAQQEIGAPYVWGAAGPNAFDCSGLVTYVYGQMGIYLPRTSSSQYYAGINISMDELQPGDLVFFDTYGSLSHVGIYVGGGDFIHAGTTSVVRSSLYEAYYSSRYAGAARIL